MTIIYYYKYSTKKINHSVIRKYGYPKEHGKTVPGQKNYPEKRHPNGHIIKLICGCKICNILYIIEILA